MTTISRNSGSQSSGDRKDWMNQQTPIESCPSAYELRDFGGDVERIEAKPEWRSLFAFTTRQDTAVIVGASISTLLCGFIRPAAAIIYGKLYDAFTLYASGTGGTSKEMLHEVTTWCMALTIVGAGTWILEGIFFMSWIIFGELQAKNIRQQMFSGLRDKSMEWYDLREDGIASLLNRIETFVSLLCLQKALKLTYPRQVRELQLAVSQPLGLMILEVVISFASLGTAFYFSWKLTLLFFATIPIVTAVLYCVSRGVGPAIEAQKRELSRVSKYASNAVTAIDSVKTFNGEDQEVWQYFATAKVITAYYLLQARCSALQFGIIKFFFVGLYVSSFWFGLYLVLHSGSSVGHVITTFVSCATAMQAGEVVLPQFLVMAKGRSAGETLKAIKAEMQGGCDTESKDGDFKPSGCSGDIEINDVSETEFLQRLRRANKVQISFAYPSNPRQNVLNNATFFFPAGETTFVIGRSGSGKSTLGNILMKHYEPSCGDVLIDGRPIQTLNTDWLRQNVMLIQQQSILFNETLLQNIQFGRKGHSSEYDVRQAARSALVENTIDELPKGFNTVVGSKNRALSGGQSQRVSIARARLRNAPVLILDESTSALDLTIRTQVMDKLRQWRKGKTTIIITHDVSQIHDDDYVYVLENAKVVQEGYRKRLSEKLQGTFARILRGAEAEEVTSPSELQHPSATASPTSHTPFEDENDAVPRRKRFSSLFSQDLALQSSHRSFAASGTRFSVGGEGLAQASAMREATIWSSPVIPDSPVDGNRRPQSQLMPFMWPRSSPQVPRSSERLSSVHSNPFLDPADPPDLASSTIPRHGTSKNAMTENHQHANLTAYFTAQARKDKEASHDPEPGSQLDQEPVSLTIIFKSVWPALPWRDRMILVVGLFTAIVCGAATPTFGWLLSQLLETYYTPENRIPLATKWALSMLASAVVDGFSSFISHYTLERSGQAWINTLRVEAFRRVLAQPKSWFEKPRNAPARLTECLDRDAEEMRNIVGRFAGVAITILTMLLVSVVWAFIIQWRLTLVSLAVAPAMYGLTRTFHWSSGKWEGKCNQASEATSNIFQETFSNIRVVRALTLETYFENKHLQSITHAFNVGKKRAAMAGCTFGGIDALTFFVVPLLFYYGAKLIKSGDGTVTPVLTAINILFVTCLNVVGMFAMIPQLNSSRATATKVLRLANLPLDQSHESIGTKRLVTPFPIRFNNLSFTYPSRPHVKTLDGVSLEIQSGSCTAIVGASGSGKSTIIALLLGLYPPDPEPSRTSPPGLTFAGHPILACNIHNVRSHMAFVPQTPLLFPSTIFANITYGLTETSPYNNLLAVEQAAHDAGIHEFITSLERGYNTLVGEGGMGLSGGQAQRVAIARALVRKPKVLVMDEATSALDVESAEGIRETIKRLRHKGGMALVIISHSTAMMRIAEQIVMIQTGKVVEKGGFNELKKRGGPFAELIGEVRGRPEPVCVDTGFGVSLQEEIMTPVRPRSKIEWARKMSF